MQGTELVSFSLGEPNSTFGALTRGFRLASIFRQKTLKTIEQASHARLVLNRIEPYVEAPLVNGICSRQSLVVEVVEQTCNRMSRNIARNNRPRFNTRPLEVLCDVLSPERSVCVYQDRQRKPRRASFFVNRWPQQIWRPIYKLKKGRGKRFPSLVENRKLLQLPQAETCLNLGWSQVKPPIDERIAWIHIVIG